MRVILIPKFTDLMRPVLISFLTIFVLTPMAIDASFTERRTFGVEVTSLLPIFV